MEKDFKVSVVIPVYNGEKYIKEAIDSIVDQSLDFQENIQMILVNDGSTDGTKDICLVYIDLYPENITYIEQENRGVTAALNAGKKYADGKYLCMFGADDYWSVDAFENVISFFDLHYDEIDMVSTKIMVFGDREYEHPMNFKYDKTRIIDLDKEPEFIQTTGGNVFYKAEAIEDIYYDEDVKIHEDILFNTLLLMNNKRYGVVSDALVYYRKYNDGSSLSSNLKENRYWYIDIPEKVYLPIIYRSMALFNEVIPFVQEVLLYGIKWRLRVPLPRDLLNDEEQDRFLSNIRKVIGYVDDERIMRMNGIPAIYRAHLLGFKYGENPFEAAFLESDCKLKYRGWTVYNFGGLGIAKITEIIEDRKQIIFKGIAKCNVDSIVSDICVIDNKGNGLDTDIIVDEELDVVSFDGRKLITGTRFSFSVNKKAKETYTITVRPSGIEQSVVSKITRSSELVMNTSTDHEILRIDNSKKYNVILNDQRVFSIKKYKRRNILKCFKRY